jgi:hypothetical protein
LLILELHLLKVLAGRVLFPVKLASQTFFVYRIGLELHSKEVTRKLRLVLYLVEFLKPAIYAKAARFGRGPCYGSVVFIDVIEDYGAAVIQIDVSRCGRSMLVRGKFFVRRVMYADDLDPLVFELKLVSLREEL